jgi:hypothetical protein
VEISVVALVVIGVDPGHPIHPGAVGAVEAIFVEAHGVHAQDGEKNMLLALEIWDVFLQQKRGEEKKIIPKKVCKAFLMP